MTAKERRAVLLAEQALKHLEFSYGDDEASDLCPDCGGAVPDDAGGMGEDDVGHGPACRLGQALVAIKEILFEDKG